jgi:hypothetical protein
MPNVLSGSNELGAPPQQPLARKVSFSDGLRGSAAGERLNGSYLGAPSRRVGATVRGRHGAREWPAARGRPYEVLFRRDRVGLGLGDEDRRARGSAGLEHHVVPWITTEGHRSRRNHDARVRHERRHPADERLALLRGHLACRAQSFRNLAVLGQEIWRDVEVGRAQDDPQRLRWDPSEGVAGDENVGVNDDSESYSGASRVASCRAMWDPRGGAAVADPARTKSSGGVSVPPWTLAARRGPFPRSLTLVYPCRSDGDLGS